MTRAIQYQGPVDVRRQGPMRSEGIRIGIIGDFEPAYHSHFATNTAIYDAAARLNIPVELRWLPTPSLTDANAQHILEGWDGLIASPGSPYEGVWR